MNFNQWKNYAAKKEVSKVTYVCGDQLALIELVIDDIKSILEVPVTDHTELDASAEVWEAASQYPLDPAANRLTVVRNAEQLTSWDQLEEWLAYSRVNPRNHIVFVSYSYDAPSIFAKGKRVSYVEHIELIRNKGKFIKCSQPNDEDLIKWARTYGLTHNTATHLIQRVSGDTSTMLDVLRKVHVWNGSPSPKAIDLLCEELALDSFADYLILRDKKTAYLALESLSEEEYARLINHLDKRLDMVMEIGRCVRKRMYAGDISAATGIKVFLVKRFLPIVKEYDDRKVRYCRQLLAMIDGARRDGAKVGTIESLITLW
jgi:hypothetical protein